MKHPTDKHAVVVQAGFEDGWEAALQVGSQRFRIVAGDRSKSRANWVRKQLVIALRHLAEELKKAN